MSSRRVLDVSELPTSVLDSRATVWWGTIVMTVIECFVLALTVGAYFYIRTIAHEWPPGRTRPPALAIPTINLAILLISVVPAVLLDRASRRRDVRMIKWMLFANLVFGTAFLTLRVPVAPLLVEQPCLWLGDLDDPRPPHEQSADFSSGDGDRPRVFPLAEGG